MSCYGLEGEKIHAGRGNENGDVEQRHHRFKRAVDQELMLRGSRDFASGGEYRRFLQMLFLRLNAGRTQRLTGEMAIMRELPERRVESVGGRDAAAARPEQASSWLSSHHRLLVCKPGAFESYRERDELLPTSRFRIVFDLLEERRGLRATKEYLRILELAARESEAGVDQALRTLLSEGHEEISAEAVKRMLDVKSPSSLHDVEIVAVDLSAFDQLCTASEVQQ